MVPGVGSEPRRSSEKPVIPQPREGEIFEVLLFELNAEFQHLYHRNLTLNQELADLRGEQPLSPKSQEPVSPKLGAAHFPANGWSSHGRPHRRSGRSVSGHSAGLAGHWMSDECALNRTSSSWRRSLVSQARYEPDPTPNKHHETPRSSHASSRRSSTAAAQRRESSQHIADTLRLKAKFEVLDSTDTGTLKREDLLRLCEFGGEPVEDADLVKLMRALYQMENRGVNGGQASEDVDSMCVTFPMFLELVDDQQPFEDLGSDVQGCVAAIRRALASVPEFRISRSSTETHEQLCEAAVESSVQPKKKRRKRSAWAAFVDIFFVEAIPLTVILLNTVLAGLSTDYPEHEGIWDVFENIFVAFYITEFAVKVGMWGCRGYFMGQECWWNIFDFVCLVMSLSDVAAKIAVRVVMDGQTSSSDSDLLMVIRIIRLSRLGRIVRTLRFKIFQELKQMVVGVVSGLQVLTWAIVLLVLSTYLVGVGMCSVVGEDYREFSSVRASMFTLFRCWTDGCTAYDGTPLSERLRIQYGPLYMVFHILMTMFVTVGLFNLIMATFIENVVSSHALRKHADMESKSPEIEMRLKMLFIKFFKFGVQRKSHAVEGLVVASRRVYDMVVHGKKRSIDKKGIEREWGTLRELKVAITKEVFMQWLEDAEFQTLLDDAEIDTVNRSELFDVLDADGGGHLSMDELTTGIMKLRGPVMKSDIVAIRLKVNYLTGIMESYFQLGGNEIVIES